MQAYKQEFIEFMVRSGVLTFGDFVTKSGRKTPYFINTGNYRTGEQMAGLGGYYAKAIVESFEKGIDTLFGPAYKGIPLVITAAVALHRDHGRNLAFCFNRKEAKDHGEGGALIGQKLRDGDRVLIVEDVTTAGSSIRETAPLLRSSARIELAGLIVSVDRMERGTGEKSALAQLSEEFEMPCKAIVDLDEVVGHLHNRPIGGQIVLDDKRKSQIEAYREKYGAR